MKSVYGGCLAVLMAAVALWSLGCGSGASPASSTGDPSRGSIELAIGFPTALTESRLESIGKIDTGGRAGGTTVGTTGTTGTTRPGAGPGIPIGAQVIRIEVIDATTNMDEGQPTIVPVPPLGSVGQAQVTLTGLKPGLVHVKATAHADQSASLAPLAIVQADVTVVAGATQPLNLVLVPTASQITIVPSSLLLDVNTNPSRSLTATVMDGGGNTIQGFPLVWSSSNSVIAAVQENAQNPQMVTVVAVGAGTAVIEVREPNTGITAQATVTVTNSTGTT